MSRFNKFSDNYDSDFNLFRTVFKFMFVFVFLLIVAQIGLYVFLGYNVLTDPEGSGEVIGKFLDGVNK